MTTVKDANVITALNARLIELEQEIYNLKTDREVTIKTLELIGKGLAYENVTKAKTQSAGNALMGIARKLKGEKWT